MEPTQTPDSADPLRGFKSFPWMDRALDPESPIHPTAGAAHTASSNVEGKEILYPTVRLNEKGVLQEYSPLDAQKIAIENDDFLSFDSPEAATAWSKDFSEQIATAREPVKPVQIGTTQEQTKALTPDAVSTKNRQLLNISTIIASSETNLDDIDLLIGQIEDEVGVFHPETGQLGGIDPTAILKEFEGKFPDHHSTPGAENFKDFLRKRINEKNYNTAVRIGTALAGGLGTSGDEFGIDLWKIIGRVTHDAVNNIMSLGQIFLDTPVHQISTILSDSPEEARATTNKIFELSTYVPEPPPPTTTLGKFTEPTAEVALALWGGGKILAGFGGVINKHLPHLKTAIEGAKVAKPKTVAAAHTIAKEMVGGPIFISPENRLAPFLKDLGMDNKMVNFLVDQPDDTAFMKALKTSLDSFFPGTAFAGAVPVVAMFSRGLYNWQKPIAKEVVKTTEGWVNKVKHLRPKHRTERVGGFESPNVVEPVGDLQAAIKIQKEVEVALQQLKSGDPKAQAAIEEALKTRGLKLNEKKKIVEIPEVAQPTIRPKDEKIINENIVKILKDPDSLNLNKTTQTFLNVKRINSTDGRVNYLNQLAKIMEASYFKDVKTNPQIAAQAKKMEGELKAIVGEENLGAYYKNWANTTDQTPAMAGAIRLYLWQEGKLWKESSDLITGLLAQGKQPSTQQLADYFLDAYRYMGSLETDLKVAANISRTLQYRRHMVGAEEKTLLDVIKGAADGGKSGKDVLISLAKNVSEAEDLLQLKAQLKNETGSLYKLFHGNKMKAQNGLLSNLTTLGGATLGMASWALQTGIEGGIKTGLNGLSRRWYEFTGNTWLGKGEGMTFTAFKAEQFGWQQAFAEVFMGKGYFKDSPFGQMLDTGVDLRTRSFGQVDDAMELTNTYGRSSMTGSDVTQKAFGKEWTMAQGINAEFTKILPEFLGLEKNQIGKILKVIANGYGFVHSSAGRLLIMEDQLFRNIFERREIHKLSAIRAEELVRSTLGDVGMNNISRKEYLKQVNLMYEKVLVNAPDDIAQQAAKTAKEGLMQETLPKFLQKVERARDKTSDLKAGKDWLAKTPEGKIDPKQSALNTGQNVLYGVGNVAINVPKNFLSSKTNFLRTAINIVNQQLYERGPLKLAKIFINDEQRAKLFSGSEEFRQDTLAKVISGTALLSAGYSLGNNFNSDDHTLYAKGLDSFDPSNFYLNQVEGSGGSEIIKRNSDGTETRYSLARIDPLNYSLMLGSIVGSARQKYLEAKVLEQKLPDGTFLKFEQDQMDEIDDMDNRLFYALGHWLSQLPMLKPVKETMETVFPGMSRTGGAGDTYDKRLAREVANWGTYINPMENGFSSLRKAIHKTKQPFNTFGPSYEDKVTVPLSEDAGVMTKVGVPVPEQRTEGTRDKNIALRIVQEYLEKVENLTIMDVTNPRYPKVGQEIVGMVGPEGKLIRHIPDTALEKAKLGFKNIGVPFYPTVLQRSVSMELIMGLGVKGQGVASQAWKDPRTWSNKWTSNVALTPLHRYTWAVYAGELNEQTFNTPEYENIIKNIKNRKYETTENMSEKISNRIIVDKLLAMNNDIAFDKMLQESWCEGLREKLLLQGYTNKISLKTGF